MAAGRVLFTAAKAAARNKAVRAVAVPAISAAARKASPVVNERYGQWRDRRRHRELAVQLARQIGGRYSADTIIAGQPHFVVWKNGKPIEAFPPVSDLSKRPEIQHFDARNALEPPPPRAR